MKNLVAATFLIASWSLGSEAAVAAPREARSLDGNVVASYEIRFSDPNVNTAEVTCHLRVDHGRLYINNWTDPPTFWRDHIRNLSVSDPSGHGLPVTSSEKDGWKVGAGFTGQVTALYSVDLSFIHHPFPSGNQKGGLAFAGSAYLVTRALFVTGDREFSQGTRRVRLDVPAGWEVAVPWSAGGDNPHAFLATSWLDLVNNSFVIGRFQKSVAREGGFTLSFALLGPIASDVPSLDRTTHAILREYLSVFPETPPDQYLMTFFYADHDDGEAWNRSAALTFSRRVSDADALLFHNTIAHELMHYWLGAGLLRSTDHDREQWLTEGFTEYYANRTIYRQGLITARDYLEKLSRHAGAYAYFWWSPVFGHVTMRDGGADKTKNRFGVYDGGAMAALCLDLRIRQLTRDRRSLDDVMRLLFDRFAQPGKTFSYEDVVAAMVEIGGEDLRSFLARYVTGHVQLPYRELLEGVGVYVLDWPLAGEAYLSEIPEGSLSRDQEAHRPRLLAVAAR